MQMKILFLKRPCHILYNILAIIRCYCLIAAKHIYQKELLLLSSHSIKHIVIPGGTICLVQPIDNGIEKMIIKTEFQSWCFKEFIAITTPKGNKKTFIKPSNKDIADWIVKSCEKLKPEIIRNAFINTILSKEHQENIILKKIPKYFVDTKIDYLHNDEEEEISENEDQKNDEDYSDEEDKKNHSEEESMEDVDNI